MTDHKLIIAAGAAIIAGTLAAKYGRRWIPNVWVRVILAAAIAGVLAYSFGRPVNLLLRAGKLIGHIL